MNISKKMNLLALVLFTLIGVTWAQENLTETALLDSKTEKASKTLELCSSYGRTAPGLDDIKTRVEIGRNNDVLDIVSEEFCLVKRIVQRCVNQSLPVADGCFTDDEQRSLQLLLNITRNLLNFACYENAEKIRLFLMADGIECIENNTNRLEQCAKEFINHSNFSNLTYANLHYNLIDNETICESYNKLQECVLDVLQTCPRDIPANIVGLLFDYIKSFTACNPVNN